MESTRQVEKRECCLQTQKGARFVSETDTEVIVKLSKYIYDNSETKPTFPEVRVSDFHLHVRQTVFMIMLLAYFK